MATGQIDSATEYTGKVFIEDRIRRVALELDVDYCHALGVMECLWLMCQEYYPKGNFGKAPNWYWANVIRYSGDGDDMVAGLVRAGILVEHETDRLRFHRWPTRPWVKYPESHRRRRERAVAAGGEVSGTMRRLVIEVANGKCLRCGSTHKLSADHIIPISRGGKTIRENLQCLCQRCNSKKGNRIEANS